MKIKIYKYLVLGISLIIPFSCSDFLTERNPNQLSTDSFWLTVDDCNQGLTAVYNSFRNQNIMNLSDETKRSDMCWPGWGRPNTTDQVYTQNFSSATPGVNSKWEALYKGIFRANQVIEGVTKLQPSLSTSTQIATANTILAQARFFRGLFHFYLYESFNGGSVIIADKVPTDESEYYKSLSKPEDVRAFYLKDLEFAYANLPAKWTLAVDNGRVTKGAAAAVLGQSYLYENNYTTADVYFKDVIENPAYGYKLVDNVGDNFDESNELNSESILEIVYSTAYKAELNVYDEDNTSNNYNAIFSSANTGGWRSVYPSCWLIMAYKKDSMDLNDPRNQIIDATAPGGVRRRDYSLRTSYSIALVDDRDLPYYGTTTAIATIFNNKETAYFRKYTNWKTRKSEKDVLPLYRSGINFRVIRLADVFLMHAECLIKGGTDDAGVAEALKFINKVRYRSALCLYGLNGSGEYPASTHDNITYNANSVMNKIMYVERPLELSVEGHASRFIDLRRWKLLPARFVELAAKVYYALDYVYFDTTRGKPNTRWQSVLHEGITDNPSAATLFGFTQAAANYNEAAHAYWPIPNGETIANPNAIKK